MLGFRLVFNKHKWCVPMNQAFAYHCWRRDISNFAMLKYRNFDGFMVSMQNAGTQWLKHMMSLALARKYDVPPPKYVQNELSNELIGHPRHQRKYPDLPRIASSHSIPHILLGTPFLHRHVKFPRYVILVRDMRASLVAHFEKKKHVYKVSFSEYLKGDVSGKRYSADIWWYIHFLNRWGEVVKSLGDEVLIVKYELLKEDASGLLGSVFAHIGIEMDDEVLQFAVSGSTKEEMLKKIDPNHWHQGVVRVDNRDPLDWFSKEDRVLFENILADNLKHDFGYEYSFM